MSQLVTKYLANNAVIGAKFRLNNNEYLRALNAAGTADVPLFYLDTSNNFDFMTQPQADVTLPLPSANKHYVTVEWVNNFYNGKQAPKAAVETLAVTNIPLTGTAPLINDGYTLNSGESIGLIGQTNQTTNGPYTYTVSNGTYTLTPRSDFNSTAQIFEGSYFPVVNGTQYGGYEVILTTQNPITYGTTNLTFVAYPSALSITAGDMLIKSGNTLSVNLATLSGLQSTNPGVAGGQLRVYADANSTQTLQTTRIDPTTGSLVAMKERNYPYTLGATDIANQYVDLPDVAGTNSVRLCPAGAGNQSEGIDFTVNYTGGTNSKTRVTFYGPLATGGVSALVAGEVINFYYTSF